MTNTIRLNIVSLNHTELEAGSIFAVFSYGKPVAYLCDGKMVVNRDFWKCSTTTSRHVNLSFPELRKCEPDEILDDLEFCNRLAKAISLEVDR